MAELLKLANQRRDAMGELFDIQTEGGRHVCMVREKYAARLVACWNACEGLRTESMESITMVGDSLKSMLDNMNQENREAIDKEDALMEALKKIRTNLNWCKGDIQKMEIAISDSISISDAAIAKAERS